MIYNVRIPLKKGKTYQEMVPAASLTIGTILILREMVKRKWQHILICEDDIELTRGMENTFKKGIKEIGKTKWDMLYLGCGSKCGYKGLSDSKTGRNKYLSPQAGLYEDGYYTFNKNDLRDICDQCTEFSQHISWAYTPGGTWCYAYSLAGAKKVLKLIDNNAGHHIDQLLANFTKKGHLRSLSFDPPIAMHEDISNREATSDIPWKS